MTGSYALKEEGLMQGAINVEERIDEGLPYTEEQLRFVLQYEMVRSWSDLLGRRTRCLFLDAAATWRVAQRMNDEVAEFLAWSPAEKEKALADFKVLCEQYALKDL